MMDPHQELKLDFPQCLEADFPDELPAACAAFESIAGAIEGADLTPLSRRSPALQTFDWRSYLHCSIARMVHAAAALRRRGVTSGRLLDYGSYFGNFSLLFARAGFSVDAVDKYRDYQAAFAGPRRVLAESGVRIHDFDDVGYDLTALDARYDVVLCMGVIEHVPSSPRPLLETLDRVLAGGGQLVIDTPNLVHLYNRQKFARGDTVLADIQAQYETELPFEGHHREYTIPELAWLLRRIGHHRISIEAFNYSPYALGTLVSRDVYNHWNMVRDPAMREYLMSVSAKPEPRAAVEPVASDWRALVEDPEQSWVRSLPAEMTDPDSGAIFGYEELQLAELRKAYDAIQHEVNVRDEMIRDLHERLVREVQLRDEIIDRLHREQDWMRSGWRRFVIRRPAPQSQSS